MNKVELMGRLVKDITITKTKTDKDMGVFTLAVPRKGQKDVTDFIDCFVFGELAAIMQKYTEKGVRIIVTGQINTSNYTDKDGNSKKSFAIIVDDFYFVDFKKTTENKPE